MSTTLIPTADPWKMACTHSSLFSRKAECSSSVSSETEAPCVERGRGSLLISCAEGGARGDAECVWDPSNIGRSRGKVQCGRACFLRWDGA
jgi:hypothetical protein